MDGMGASQAEMVRVGLRYIALLFADPLALGYGIGIFSGHTTDTRYSVARDMEMEGTRVSVALYDGHGWGSVMRFAGLSGLHSATTE